MTDLREQLKKRFLDLAVARQMRETSDGMLEEIPFAEQVPLWDVVADECIRQMEWARYQVPTWMAPTGIAKIELTPAPDGWQP